MKSWQDERRRNAIEDRRTLVGMNWRQRGGEGRGRGNGDADREWCEDKRWWMGVAQ